MKARRILVVDDEPGIRQSLSGVLEDEGYAVESVEDGEACLAAVPGAGRASERAEPVTERGKEHGRLRESEVRIGSRPLLRAGRDA